MKNAHDLVEQARTRIQEIPLGDAEAAIQAADIVIDVREADEFREGHINGATNIPRGLLEFKLSGTPELGARDMNIVLYCKTSGRAALSAASLQDMGYLHVKSIAGGFDAWTEAGKPVAKPSLPSFE
ncbi:MULTISPECIES: rhodanese-like domain-containing protein [Pseudomonadaceae]|jgi:rhodanese-related sulfurtransferase|uniref:Sulfurtransferase n=2 Tax=Stutzerimonas TaxID=2901164 RepID=A0A365PZT8_9GAMM|nr:MULTISPECIES: rhodanese-like domain-containing protein [Pseudomonadaceae]MAL35164.1 sulfurtransferase [Pseudomonas sp.]MBU0949409.1 sulfurtransferase [Gammaproteobacteria bacterium]ANF27735.1 sulfurtransferase [Stutzerimonas stutzeri]KJJ63852.1 sulfurtransferase [Pseudomonas sp. 10B238]MBK3795023.1 sulfurtransferase [Stutzerimonas stutzeri]|tara:strand:+ start:1780 stop:2160 length:381 start_codon:yes stop_codon:yes gene_type:complete